MTSRRRFIAAAATSAATIAIVNAPAKAAQFEFRCGSVIEPDRPAMIRMIQMFAAIEQESGGRIHTSVFPSNQLGSESAMFGQLRVGALHFMMISPGFLASVIPLADISNIGFIFKSEDEALRVMSGPVGGYVRNEAITKGVTVMREMWNAGMYQIGSSPRPIKVPDDLHGFKIRVAGKIAVDLFKELGASPVAMNLNEVYTSLQTKLIDGEAAPLTTIETTHFYEVNKYVSLTNHGWVGEWIIANPDVWKSLPADLQDIVQKNHTKYSALANKDTAVFNASLVTRLRGHGTTVNDVDQTPFRPRLATYYQTWARDFGPGAWGALQSAVGRKV